MMGIKYKINNVLDNDIACFLRDPDKQSFLKNSAADNTIKFIVKNHIADIKKHYGVENYQKAIGKLSDNRKKFFEFLEKSKMELSNECKIKKRETLSFNSDTNEVVGENIKINFDDFCQKCFHSI